MEERQETKICPFCKKEVLKLAKKCRFCGNWLNETSNETKHYVQTKLSIGDTPSYIPAKPQVNETMSKQCPYCRQLIPFDAQKCQYCGEWVKEREKKANRVYAICGGLIGTIVALIGLILEIGSDGSGAGWCFALCAAIILGIYFLPTTLADQKFHKNTTAIFVVNLFFGYTIIGWVICLVWALTEEQ